ncbi:MAG: IclR family transcriptional regulator [Maledivibacter sp.]|jgi:DNA-binding IclR family transcriptional regulator|nr:IclR family transcriptional regulator [Maledivibacter sp.]
MARSILSINKAIKLLTYISEKGNSCSLADISKDLDMPKSTLFGILASLEENDMIKKRDMDNKYSLGLKTYKLGKIYERDFDMKNFVRPYLEGISKKYNESGHLAVLLNNQALYIDLVESSHSIRNAAIPGQTDELYCTSVGRIILAAMENKDIEEYLENIELKPRTTNTIVDKESLLQEIDNIRKTNLSYEFQEYEIGLICISTSIMNSNDEFLATIGLSLPIIRSNEDVLDNIGKDLLEIKASIEKAI